MKQIENDVEELSKNHCLHGDFTRMDTFLASRKEMFRINDLIKKRHSKNKKGGGFDLYEKLHDLKETLSNIECSNCKKKKHCMTVMKRMVWQKRELDQLGVDAIETENMQRDNIRRRLNMLRSLDYIDDNGLLPRGKIAAQVFGYELQFTELYFEGIFEGLDLESINVLVSAIVFESRRSCPWRKIKDRKLADVIDRADHTVCRLRAIEQQAGLPHQVKPLDTNLCAALLSWCRGATFEQLRTFELDDGDLVRSFRLIVDFLRQLKRSIPDPSFQEKLTRCVRLIYRDVVDAEAQLSIQM